MLTQNDLNNIYDNLGYLYNLLEEREYSRYNYAELKRMLIDLDTLRDKVQTARIQINLIKKETGLECTFG